MVMVYRGLSYIDRPHRLTLKKDCKIASVYLSVRPIIMARYFLSHKFWLLEWELGLGVNALVIKALH
jgi:hypothetical protein